MILSHHTASEVCFEAYLDMQSAYPPTWAAFALACHPLHTCASSFATRMAAAFLPGVHMGGRRVAIAPLTIRFFIVQHSVTKELQSGSKAKLGHLGCPPPLRVDGRFLWCSQGTQAVQAGSKKAVSNVFVSCHTATRTSTHTHIVYKLFSLCG